MPDGFDIDHTSFAVLDALSAGRWARRELGATPVFGEVLTDFRYLLMHVGTAAGGGRIEFMEPVTEDGFLGRFVARHGERPHHLTFTVPDVEVTVARVRAAGFRIVGEDFGHPPWREAFVMPDRFHGVVVQLADTDRSFPTPDELLATRERRADRFPSNRGASGGDWWTSVWDEPSGPAVTSRSTELVSTDLGASDRLFRDVLHGEVVARGSAGRRYAWARSELVVRGGDRAGVVALGVDGLRAPHLTIADTLIRPEGADSWPP